MKNGERATGVTGRDRARIGETVHGVTEQRTDVGPVVTISRGPGTGQCFWLGYRDITIIGRNTDCDVALSHSTVSAQHAEIRRIRDEFVLVDLGSLNGSYVRTQPVDTIPLCNDDEISIGIFRLVISGLDDLSTGRCDHGSPSGGGHELNAQPVSERAGVAPEKLPTTSGQVMGEC